MHGYHLMMLYSRCLASIHGMTLSPSPLPVRVDVLNLVLVCGCKVSTSSEGLFIIYDQASHVLDCGEASPVDSRFLVTLVELLVVDELDVVWNEAFKVTLVRPVATYFEFLVKILV